ncbi:2-hydroxyacid dehydrogenase, partial [Sinorhizobium meliloti]
MPKIELLQVGPYPSWDDERLNAHFTMHRYFEA